MTGKNAEESQANSSEAQERMVIDQPSLQKPVLRGLEFIISAGMWLLFLYLLQLLTTSLLWFAGGWLIYGKVLEPESLQNARMLLTAIFAYAIMVFGTLYAWAQWNYWRYGRLERRKFRPPVADETVAWHYDVPVELVWLARRVKKGRIMPQASGMTIKVLAGAADESAH